MTGAEFRAAVMAPVATGESVKLAGVTVIDAVDLACESVSPLDVSGVTFQAPVSFAGARFAGLAWFKGARFEAPANFTRAEFANDARFDGSRFAGAAEFSRVRFSGTAAFDRAWFDGVFDLSRAQVSGSLSLAHAKIYGAAHFRDMECLGGLWCEATQFLQRVDLAGAEVHGRTWLRGATTVDKTGGAQNLSRALTSLGYQWL